MSCMHACMCMYVCMHGNVYVCIHVGRYVGRYVCLSVRLSVCMSYVGKCRYMQVQVYVGICRYMWVYVGICRCMQVYVGIFIEDWSDHHGSDRYICRGYICRLWWLRPCQSYVPTTGQLPKTQVIRLECSPFLDIGRMSGTSTRCFSCHFVPLRDLGSHFFFL